MGNFGSGSVQGISSSLGELCDIVQVGLETTSSMGRDRYQSDCKFIIAAGEPYNDLPKEKQDKLMDPTDIKAAVPKRNVTEDSNEGPMVIRNQLLRLFSTGLQQA